MNQPAIEIKDLTWSYGESEHKALDGVNLTLDQGEFVGIVGPNEAGKTTLAAAMKGIIPQSFNGIYLGTVDLFGRPIVDYDAAECASLVGLVFSDPDAQFTTMSVEEEITFGLENIGTPIEVIQERLHWACELAGLERLLQKSPFELSGGQKQRVAIAGVLAMRPKIIILDEPTSMLDPVSKKGVFSLLAEVKRSLDLTVVVIEHNLEQLVEVCDRMILMEHGTIAVDAPLGTFFQQIPASARDSIRVPGTVTFFDQIEPSGEITPEDQSAHRPVRFADVARVCGGMLAGV
ncbi:ABC transporter ATP-binding protein [Propionimicrobium sp. PCR01-08-3]|uniref:energy-coupling factor ABC transporter ATP-binding protein n=1 Tax=Propionimicrobium sp. PCR01-08-3 TaxID=3052086 RepID=UPI00255CBC5C|nr:ABC transporter ATP-binding protein [Propionimicrobium sp. PCR01-08-3]WIY82532.1 ABC transporter ATP-binding protein [Propionimicrobium sp. PCR01-08-3]